MVNSRHSLPTMASQMWSSKTTALSSPARNFLTCTKLALHAQNIIATPPCKQWYDRISRETPKKTMMKCAMDGSNVYQALLNLRNTPRPGILLSPVQLMKSRRTKTSPAAKSLLAPTAIPNTTTIRRQRQIAQATRYNHKARDVPPLQEGDSVRIKPTNLGDKQ